ncbi:hypothetical protein N7472_010399 [Penicillium cf. griseofulvum]|uniref:Uncharacterized protein n=1 Tax=Penicillium cf. griseofulvum TaxID=2972120 RepID=A0A9W9M1W0_9EURO|nr:hypothetical protein N7472_010399 [Penicillium cf. griseofulvum]
MFRSFVAKQPTRINNATAVLRGLIYSLGLQGYFERPNLTEHPFDYRRAGRLYNRPSPLDLITQILSANSQVKWIISSNKWREIEERLDITQTAPISLELNEASVSEAVKKFIQRKVDALANVKGHSNKTRDTISCHWVALVCQQLGRALRWHALKKPKAFPTGLYSL